MQFHFIFKFLYAYYIFIIGLGGKKVFHTYLKF